MAKPSPASSPAATRNCSVLLAVITAATLAISLAQRDENTGLAVEQRQSWAKLHFQCTPRKAPRYRSPSLQRSIAMALETRWRRPAKDLVRQECNARQSRPVHVDAVTRDRDHFSFREVLPGILMLDCDLQEGQEPLGWQEIDETIAAIIPAWAKTQRLWRPSSSAYIYDADGTEVIGRGSWRCYVAVDDASAIPALGAYIYQRLWDIGRGFIVVSKSGQALDRSLIDASVWQPERIDFAAEPVLEGGLVRRAPSPMLMDGAPWLATAEFKNTPTPCRMASILQTTSKSEERGKIAM